MDFIEEEMLKSFLLTMHWEAKGAFTTQRVNGLLVYLTRASHFTSEKSPWQYFVLSKNRRGQYSHVDKL